MGLVLLAALVVLALAEDATVGSAPSAEPTPWTSPFAPSEPKPPKPGGGSAGGDVVVQLQDRPGLHIKNPATAWGTAPVVRAIEDAVDWFIACADDLGVGGREVRIGDISAAGGGPLGSHLSHQEGRDVDVSIQGERLPVDALPCLLWAFLATDLVSTVFLDYGVQAALWDALEGHPLEALRAELQYPNGPKFKGVRVVHWPGHADHLHVRYRA